MDGDIEKGIDELVEGATFHKDLKKTTAMKTDRAYAKTIIAATEVAPVCLSLGGTDLPPENYTIG